MDARGPVFRTRAASVTRAVPTACLGTSQWCYGITYMHLCYRADCTFLDTEVLRESRRRTLTRITRDTSYLVFGGDIIFPMDKAAVVAERGLQKIMNRRCCVVGPRCDMRQKALRRKTPPLHVGMFELDVEYLRKMFLSP